MRRIGRRGMGSMKIEEFSLERIQSLYENTVEFNLSDSGVHAYSLNELLSAEQRAKLINLLDDGESNLLPSVAPPGGVGEAVETAGGRSRLDLWWWIVACAALPLLLIEWWVYTRRVHL